MSHQRHTHARNGHQKYEHLFALPSNNTGATASGQCFANRGPGHESEKDRARMSAFSLHTLTSFPDNVDTA